MKRNAIALLLNEFIKSLIVALPPLLFLLCTSEFTRRNILITLVSRVGIVFGVTLPEHVVSKLNVTLFCVSFLMMLLFNSIRLYRQNSIFLSGNKTQQNTLKDLMKAACICIRNQIVENIAKDIEERDSLRVSLYITVPIGAKGEKGFSCCGRYSKNLRYTQMGRIIYPIKQGIIGRAWEKGEYCKSALPLDPLEYSKEMTALGYTESEVHQFTMNAHFIYAKRIEDSNFEPSGLIVVEMINPVENQASAEDIIAQIKQQLGAFSSVVNKFGEKFVELSALESKV